MSCTLGNGEAGANRAKSALDARPYALGYSESEFSRLKMQAAFLQDLTEDLLRRAGLRPGMHVLDLGCGVGDVSLAAARLVGPSGLVLGVDRSPDAVRTAELRAMSERFHWIRFTAADLDIFDPDQTFDAIIGRLILMYLRDPAAILRRLRTQLRPRGIVAFQEMAMPLARTVPAGPTFQQCSDWILATFERAGFEIDMGGKLFASFLAAGLPAPEMIVAGRVEGGPNSQIYDYLAETMRSLLPVMEHTGVATAAEVDIDSVAERLRNEAVSQNAGIMPPPLIGAWARTPA
jgi:ubiquinone/menaquinone biosynthesis C-methylase UbiE